jgi:F420-dependent oxidoreductase-like protein
VKFGLQVPSFSYPGGTEAIGPNLERIVRTADEVGFDSIWVMDHLFQIRSVGAADEPMLEGWTALGWIAAMTKRARIGLMVGGIHYREPGIWVKAATTLDVLSGGRAWLGLGAAWNEEEHIGYGIDFPPVKERMDRLDEALTIAKLMFTVDRPTFEGEHYRIHEVLNHPRPIQPGGPPILVGGVGEQRTLRIAAKHADLTHWFAIGLEALRHKDEVLTRYCEEYGRDPASIERTIGAPVIVMPTEAEAKAFVEVLPPERRPYVVAGTPDQVVDTLAEYIDAGFTGFTFNNAMYRTPEQIATVGELLRMVRTSVPA